MAWQAAKSQFITLCRVMIEDLQIGNPFKAEHNKPQSVTTSKRVFIVHGHDDGMKESVARVLSKIGLEPVILHEQSDQGKTVIEKFIAHSDVGFAVVLLSGDDIAYPKSGKPKQARPRARQNVILELGFFVGKLGRERVLPLYRKADNFELPSDFAGVLYKEFDDHGKWQFELARELKAAGYDVDANKLIVTGRFNRDPPGSKRGPFGDFKIPHLSFLNQCFDIIVPDNIRSLCFCASAVGGIRLCRSAT